MIHTGHYILGGENNLLTDSVFWEITVTDSI